ncbi:hypothetical protein BO82DRAFT_356926 [Aspergillus uvarum CBS 121591]|uniref:Uncharacterized protein n=1 Tax=Aspergillus uvarum CBS 121591 TaxID=1448315 RepID=A0A319BZ00_9EURO|nr:hypothetical protein BO82DRAFT_356926 [Aspergillus uvarum CBS 121591]PYH78936.1 hypothetical protein BO82DRAFT_356926 [Aspergillus uvarum CBS 121591]
MREQESLQESVTTVPIHILSGCLALQKFILRLEGQRVADLEKQFDESICEHLHGSSGGISVRTSI